MSKRCFFGCNKSSTVAEQKKTKTNFGKSFLDNYVIRLNILKTQNIVIAFFTDSGTTGIIFSPKITYLA